MVSGVNSYSSDQWREAPLWAVFEDQSFSRGHTLEAALQLRHDRQILVPDVYADAPTSYPDSALEVAHIELERLVEDAQARKGPNLTFGDVEYVGSFSPMCWLFRRYCAEWQDDGLVPGAASCLVDRIDLRIWHPEELEEFWKFQGKE